MTRGTFSYSGNKEGEAAGAAGGKKGGREGRREGGREKDTLSRRVESLATQGTKREKRLVLLEVRKEGGREGGWCENNAQTTLPPSLPRSLLALG